MPTICTFFGIVIRMYYREHAPPHFHVYYQEHEATVDIEALEVRTGRLPRRALGLVLDWAELHQQELRHNWTLAQRQEVLQSIRPLE
ncbi:MAG: DUF4160 domain-containing protein [Chloroflexi bacterium]|nr:DUF4160 domain-containing protein [Chloroflexota bacterium]